MFTILLLTVVTSLLILLGLAIFVIVVAVAHLMCGLLGLTILLLVASLILGTSIIAVVVGLLDVLRVDLSTKLLKAFQLSRDWPIIMNFWPKMDNRDKAGKVITLLGLQQFKQTCMKIVPMLPIIH